MEEKTVTVGEIKIDTSKCMTPEQFKNDSEAFDLMYKNATPEERAIIDSWNGMGR